MAELKEVFPGVFRIDGKLATRNTVPGHRVYGEELVKIDKAEYRVWDHRRSKLAAAVLLGLKQFPIKQGMNVLYLGAATGTTASHIADIVEKGLVYCVEFAPRAMRYLLKVCEVRKNMIPIFADARKPTEYKEQVGRVDCIYEDVAQPDQVRILAINAAQFLRIGAPALIAIKSQSIDATKSPKEVFQAAIKELEDNFEIIEKIDISRWHSGHLFVSMRLR